MGRIYSVPGVFGGENMHFNDDLSPDSRSDPDGFDSFPDSGFDD